MRTTDLPERAAPLVSVIIPTFERPESLQRAVQSVLTQTMADLEVIVVNDGGGPLESQVAALTAALAELIADESAGTQAFRSVPEARPGLSGAGKVA